ncbi:hypothetical protein BC830DRAFT_1118574 [Chytriomyces sp. MP71]|nr:hypothetical protein BC830DRAFT_1118574 [Chytriomyces sp. MP71]
MTQEQQNSLIAHFSQDLSACSRGNIESALSISATPSGSQFKAACQGQYLQHLFDGQRGSSCSDKTSAIDFLQSKLYSDVCLASLDAVHNFGYSNNKPCSAKTHQETLFQHTNYTTGFPKSCTTAQEQCLPREKDAPHQGYQKYVCNSATGFGLSSQLMPGKSYIQARVNSHVGCKEPNPIVSVARELDACVSLKVENAGVSTKSNRISVLNKYFFSWTFYEGDACTGAEVARYKVNVHGKCAFVRMLDWSVSVKRVYRAH